MFKYLGLALAALVAGLILAGDYSAKRKAQGPDFGPSDYVAAYAGKLSKESDWVSNRIVSSLIRPRKVTETRIFLPDAPPGWRRMEWTPALEARMQPRQELTEEERELRETLASNPMIPGLMDSRDTANFRQKLWTTWAYRKGGSLVFVTATHEPPGRARDNGRAFAAANLEALAEASPFGVIGGVVFIEPGGDALAGAAPNADRPRHLRAVMGDAVTLNVQARATEEEIRTVLAGIDYDGLNALLARPETNVGSNALPMTPVQEQFVAATTLSSLKRAAEPALEAAEMQLVETEDVSASGGSRMASADDGREPGDETAGQSSGAGDAGEAPAVRVNRPNGMRGCGSGTFCKAVQ